MLPVDSKIDIGEVIDGLGKSKFDLCEVVKLSRYPMPLRKHINDKGDADYAWHRRDCKTITVTQSVNNYVEDTHIVGKGAVDKTWPP